MAYFPALEVLAAVVLEMCLQFLAGVGHANHPELVLLVDEPPEEGVD